MGIKALWDPGWYNLDQSLAVGRRERFAFYRPHLMPATGYDLIFANTVGGDWTYRSATVTAIVHGRFGPVDEVDTTQFGDYTFRFHDRRWVTIDTEEGVGHVNASSPDFPHCDREWATNSGWALTVTLDDVTDRDDNRRKGTR